jgi:hypothetical protein
MASPQERAQCVLWYEESKSVTVQRNFRRVYQDAPPDKCIRNWYQQFPGTGSVLKGHPPCRPSTSQDGTERVRVAFQRSPKRSVRRVSRQLQIPKSTVYVAHRILKLRTYKLQLEQHVQSRDKPQRANFVNGYAKTAQDSVSYLRKIIRGGHFTHTHGVVNRPKCRMRVSDTPRGLMEHVRSSISDRIFGPFHESIITSAVYLDILENSVLPHVVAEVDCLIYQTDGALAHFGAIVRTSLDERFPDQWIGNGRPINLPPWSPDLRPVDSYFRGYIKDILHRKRVESLPDLRRRITAAISAVPVDVSLGCEVKWSFVSASVGPSVLLTLDCNECE